MTFTDQKFAQLETTRTLVSIAPKCEARVCFFFSLAVFNLSGIACSDYNNFVHLSSVKLRCVAKIGRGHNEMSSPLSAQNNPQKKTDYTRKVVRIISSLYEHEIIFDFVFDFDRKTNEQTDDIGQTMGFSDFVFRPSEPNRNHKVISFSPLPS